MKRSPMCCACDWSLKMVEMIATRFGRA